MKNRNMRSDHETGRQHGDSHFNLGEGDRHQHQHHDRSEWHHGGGRDGRSGRKGGGRNRARRGEARYIFLDVLHNGPKHGYEIIKTLEERSAGQYVPSPGTVYPTLQYLEDQGSISAIQDAERRVYQLTEAGKIELEAQAEAVAEFWSRFEPKEIAAPSQPEISFLEDELEHLNRTVWSGLRHADAQKDQSLLRSIREAVEACQRQVRELIVARQM